jgi:hypothetical protein
MRPPRSAPTAAPGQGFWTDLRLQEVAAALEATVVATLGSIANDGLELADGADLKGHHRVDDQLSGDITAWWETSRLPVRLYLEGQAPQDPPGGTAVAALLIDPIDGSINRDLMVAIRASPSAATPGWWSVTWTAGRSMSWKSIWIAPRTSWSLQVTRCSTPCTRFWVTILAPVPCASSAKSAQSPSGGSSKLTSAERRSGRHRRKCPPRR